MSWLSSFVNHAAGWGGEDPQAVAQRQAAAAAEAQRQQQAQAQAEADAQAQAQAQAVAAQQAAAPVYSGPTAEAKLQALLPGGFENTLIPSSVASPYISSTASSGRAKAQDFIQNMLKRGVVTESGRASALNKLSEQDPTVTNKLTGISNTLLENERAKLRGIAGEGYGAAAGQSGEFFDPSSYQSRANTDASAFLQGFPASFASSVGDVGGLYDTSGLGAAGGAATGGQTVGFDPYAVEGGKLSTGTGTDDQGTARPKKRSTAVF